MRLLTNGLIGAGCAVVGILVGRLFPESSERSDCGRCGEPLRGADHCDTCGWAPMQLRRFVTAGVTVALFLVIQVIRST